MSFSPAEEEGTKTGLKTGSPAIMGFTAAALEPPAGLNQTPASLSSAAVSEIDTELGKSGTQTQYAL